ncbi:MAG: AMP-binding protein [Candidatus Caldarchaeum sp.]
MKKYQRPIRKIPTVRAPLGLRTIPALLEASVERFKDSPAYIASSKGTLSILSFREAFERVTRLSRHLKELGFGKGDRIAILGENSPNWALSFFAVSWLGATTVPLDARANLDALRAFLDFSGASCLIYSHSFHDASEALQRNIPKLKLVLPMDEIEGIRTQYSSGTPMGDVKEDDIAEILFTSGSTGEPKGVMLSHGNIMSNVDDIYQILDVTTEDRAFSILPMHHAYESTAGMISPFASGMSVYYARSLKPREMLEDLRIAKPTIWLSTPLILEKLLKRINSEIDGARGIKGALFRHLPRKLLSKSIRKHLGLERIRLIVSGGAALSPAVSHGLEKLGLPIIQGYGLTETAPLVTVNPPSRPINESVGMVIPSTEVEIRDIDSDGNGEIVVRGPNVMKGYYENPKATSEVITKDGWLLTGDVGYFDEEGYLYITGRKKFVIVTPGGKNIYPEEIEEVLCRSPYVSEALVISQDGRTLQAIIYPDFNETKAKLSSIGLADDDELLWKLIEEEVRRANRSLEPYKRVHRFAIRREEFPKTTSQKIRRHLFSNLSISPMTRFLDG